MATFRISVLLLIKSWTFPYIERLSVAFSCNLQTEVSYYRWCTRASQDANVTITKMKFLMQDLKVGPCHFGAARRRGDALKTGQSSSSKEDGSAWSAINQPSLPYQATSTGPWPQRTPQQWTAASCLVYPRKPATTLRSRTKSVSVDGPGSCGRSPLDRTCDQSVNQTVCFKLFPPRLHIAHPI